MLSSFSDRLLALARPHLGWAVEQLDLFDHLVPHDATRVDLDAPSVSRGTRTLGCLLLGSQSADGTWLWAWGDESLGDTPGAARAAELRALGEREDVPELTRPMLDLNGFPDPRQAGDHLLLLCMGLLDARGAAITGLGGGSRVLVLIDDPAVPVAESRADRLTRALRTGPALLPGPQLTSVQGWFARHHLTPEYGPGRVSGTLPGQDRVTATLEGDAVASVTVTGPDGGPPRSHRSPEQTLAVDARAESARRLTLFPAELLPVAAREVAPSLRSTVAMVEYAGKHLGFEGRPPVWDAEAGRLRFPGGGLRARELGRYDLDEGWFAWAPGTEEIRARFRTAAGLDEGAAVAELAADRLDLSRYAAPESVAVVLARTAASAAGYVFTSLGTRFLAVTDEVLPAPYAGHECTGREIEAGATWLHGITPADQRAEVMRTLATSYCERFGMTVQSYGTRLLSGMSGLYEVRVFFAPDGSITRTSEGLLHTPHA